MLWGKSKAGDKCLIPCKGLYADVVKNMDFIQVEQLDMFKNNLAKYNDFKAGFGSEEMIKNEITGYFPKANKNCNI